MLCVNFFILIVVIVVVVVVVGGGAVKSESGNISKSNNNKFLAPLQLCRMDDEACFLIQSQTFLRAFKNGTPDGNLPSLEPLQLGTLRVDSGGSSAALQFHLTLMNTTMHNFGNSVVVKSFKGFEQPQSLSLKKPLKLTMVTDMAKLEVHAKYDVNGKILVLPIISKGDVIIKLNNVSAKSRIIAEPMKHPDGKIYLKVNEYKTISKVKSGHFHMTNLFDDNKELHDSTMKLLNDEFEAISQDVQPKINEALDKVFLKIFQYLWAKIPYDEFFLKSTN